MAFPTVEGTTGVTNESANATSHTPTLPTVSGGVLQNDILVAIYGKDGAGTASWHADWTEIIDVIDDASACSLHVAYYRVPSNGTTPTVSNAITTTASERGSIRTYCLRGCHTSQAPEVASLRSSGAGLVPDPPSLTASWGTEDNLWIALNAHDDLDTTTAYPTNFTLVQEQSVSSGTGSGGVGVAMRQLNNATQDPGTFTISASEEWIGHTIAFRPAAVSSDTTVTPGVIARAFTVPQSAISVASTPAAVTRSFTTPTQMVSVAAAPATVTRSILTQAPAVSVAATPVDISRVFTVPQVSASESTIVASATITRAFTLPAPTVSIAAVPATIVRAYTVPPAAVTVAAVPATVARSFVIPQVTIDGGGAGDANVSPAVIARAFTLLTPAIAVDLTASVIIASGTLQQPTLNISAGPVTVARAFVIPQVTVLAAAGAAPAAIAMALTFPVFFVLTDNLPIPSGIPVLAARRIYAVTVISDMNEVEARP